MTAYTITAHPTTYAGVRFRSRLEARWAAFFDLATWQWAYEPLDLVGWTPDFLVTIPCAHSGCGIWRDGVYQGPGKGHQLLVEVKPYSTIAEFANHPAAQLDGYAVPSPACFGLDPSVTYWVMCCGSGGGQESVMCWCLSWEALWAEAGNITQWHPTQSSAVKDDDRWLWESLPSWFIRQHTNEELKKGLRARGLNYD